MNRIIWIYNACLISFKISRMIKSLKFIEKHGCRLDKIVYCPRNQRTYCPWNCPGSRRNLSPFRIFLQLFQQPPAEAEERLPRLIPPGLKNPKQVPFKEKTQTIFATGLTLGINWKKLRPFRKSRLMFLCPGIGPGGLKKCGNLLKKRYISIIRRNTREKSCLERIRSQIGYHGADTDV